MLKEGQEDEVESIGLFWFWWVNLSEHRWVIFAKRYREEIEMAGIGFVIGMMVFPLMFDMASLAGLAIGGVIGGGIGFAVSVVFPDL